MKIVVYWGAGRGDHRRCQEIDVLNAPDFYSRISLRGPVDPTVAFRNPIFTSKTYWSF